MLDAPSLSQVVPPESAALLALLAKAERGQWQAADIFDGREKTSLPVWVPVHFVAAVVSQFHHGEKATIRMCEKLLPSLSDPVARRLVELQIVDECRHAEAYRMYLEGLEPLCPVDPILEEAYDKALSWEVDNGKDDGAMVAAFTIVLEGEALFSLKYLDRWFTCPRFRGMSAAISRDEARHHAFGRAYLKSVFSNLGPDQRRDVYDRLRGLWHETASGLFQRFRIPTSVLRRRCRTWVETGWLDHEKVLTDIGLIARADTQNTGATAL